MVPLEGPKARPLVQYRVDKHETSGSADLKPEKPLVRRSQAKPSVEIKPKPLVRRFPDKVTSVVGPASRPEGERGSLRPFAAKANRSTLNLSTEVDAVMQWRPITKLGSRKQANAESAASTLCNPGFQPPTSSVNRNNLKARTNVSNVGGVLKGTAAMEDEGKFPKQITRQKLASQLGQYLCDTPPASQMVPKASCARDRNVSSIGACLTSPESSAIERYTSQRKITTRSKQNESSVGTLLMGTSKPENQRPVVRINPRGRDTALRSTTIGLGDTSRPKIFCERRPAPHQPSQICFGVA
eukprot:Selendium_serpulae@DN5942_c0_g2_i3.p1